MSKFLQLDLDTCSAFDIIDQSMVTQPSLFLETLAAAGQSHHSYGMRCYDRQTRDNCQRWCKETMRAHRRLKRGLRAMAACDTFHNTIEAFSVAARLQGIPPHLREYIIARSHIGE